MGSPCMDSADQEQPTWPGVLPPCAEPMSRMRDSSGCTSLTLSALITAPLGPFGRFDSVYFPARAQPMLKALLCILKRSSGTAGILYLKKPRIMPICNAIVLSIHTSYEMLHLEQATSLQRAWTVWRLTCEKALIEG